MAMRDLMPWGRRATVPFRGEESSPFFALQREMNRMFDDFFRGFDAPLPAARTGWNWPRVDMAESESEFRVIAELPGLDEKDVEIVMQDGVLTLRGEKKAEGEGNLYSERWHGQFERSIQLGPDVDPDRVSATFRNGVLIVTAAKRAESQRSVKRIPIAH